jgi:hypothetical protein
MPIENRESHGFDPTPTREVTRRVRRDEAVDYYGHLQASLYYKDQRQMRHGMNRLHSHCPDTPPVMVSLDDIITQGSLIS